MSDTAVEYSLDQQIGVAFIASAGLVSILAILCYSALASSSKKRYSGTHVIPYLGSLLVANAIQSTGTVMNLRWVLDKGVRIGGFCSIQGAIKHAGNVATAISSLALCIHLFKLLFWRQASKQTWLLTTLVGGWVLVGFIVLIGPTAIHTKAQGPYFTAAGYWCWISKRYWGAQTYLEYFLMFVSAGASLVLYTIILLRVRGNLTIVDGTWRLVHIARGQRWKLAIARDSIDTAMLKVARSMVWYPVAFTVLISPIALCRLMASFGRQVPFGLIAFAATIFNLIGFVNVVLLFVTKRLFPDVSTLPSFNTPRKQLDPNSAEANGITPFVLAVDTPPLARRNYSLERNASRSSTLSSAPSVSEVLRFPQMAHR